MAVEVPTRSVHDAGARSGHYSPEHRQECTDKPPLVLRASTGAHTLASIIQALTAVAVEVPTRSAHDAGAISGHCSPEHRQDHTMVRQGIIAKLSICVAPRLS